MQYVFPLDSATAEYIFAPLHDPEHSSSIPVEVQAKSATSVYRSILWCYTNVGWTNCAADATACECLVPTPFEAKHHRTLICSLVLPKDVGFQIALLRPGLRPRSAWSPEAIGTGLRQEIELDLDTLLGNHGKILGGDRFSGVALRLIAHRPGPRVVSLSWIGLRNAQVWATTRALRAHWTPSWDAWLLPRKQWGERKFERGLLFDYEALSAINRKRKNAGWREHFAVLEKRAAACMDRNPEADFGEYLPNHDVRYLREHEQGRTAYHWDALVLAFVGLVKSDDALVEKALHFLMCMVHTRYWTDSAEGRISSSTWNQRGFLEEMTTTSVAILSDWLAFALTPAAKALIRKALWDRGMAPVKRDLLQFDYMHSMNQGAVFCRAGVLGGLMIECAWPRVRSHTDESYHLMKEVLGRYVKADGGVYEGIGYLCQMLTATMWTAIAYARARGLAWEEEVRSLFGNVEQYVAVMSSLTPGKGIPSGDCRLEWFSGDAIPIFAALYPGSAFENILQSCLVEGWVHEVTGTLAKSGGLVGMVYGPESVRASRTVVPERKILPESGKATFSGQASGQTVRLWISANQKEATHAHRDHGNFALEVGSIPVFVDRGQVQYWLVESHYLYRSYLHNVLTPVAVDGSFPDQESPTEHVTMRSSDPGGGETLTISSGGVWREWMREYQRRYRVILPNEIVLEDQGDLFAQGQVALHLQSRLPFEVRGRSFSVKEQGFSCEVHCPWAQSLTVQEDLTDFAGRPVFRLCAVSDPVGSFRLESVIRLSISS